MEHSYIPSGVCSRKIDFSLENGKIHNVHFTGGCSGNTQGVGALIEGMDAKEAISRIKGIKCGKRPTSCPDQLALALEQALEEENNRTN